MAVQTMAMWAAGPYVTGRLVARHWKGREAALAVVLMTTWAALAFAAPFVVTTGTYSLPGRPDLTVTTGTSASLLGATLMVAFVSWGTLRERLHRRCMTPGPAQPI